MSVDAVDRLEPSRRFGPLHGNGSVLLEIVAVDVDGLVILPKAC